MITACQAGELDRRDRIAALDSYLRELDVEPGPVSESEQSAAREGADGALGDPAQAMPGRASRTA